MKTYTKYKYLLFLLVLTFTEQALAFSKLKDGFETITNTFLMPLMSAVAGAALITFVILSYFNQQENMKKAAAVFGLTIIGKVGIGLLLMVQNSFS